MRGGPLRARAGERDALALAVDKRKALEQASKYAQKGQLDKALVEYQRVLQADPHDAQVRLRIGDLLLRKGEPEKAIQAYLHVGAHLASKGFEAKAVAIYKQILKIDANQPEVRMRLGDLYQRLGLVQDALRELEQSAEHYRARGAKEKAFELLRRVASLNPDNIANRLGLANLLHREGMESEAEEEYRALLRHTAEASRAEERARVAEQMIEHLPDDEEALRAFATAKIQCGQASRAVERLRKLLNEQPENVVLRELLAEAFSASGDPASSQTMYRETAELYKQRGDVERARDILQRYASPGAVEESEETSPSLVLTDEVAEATPSSPSLRFADELGPPATREPSSGAGEHVLAEARMALQRGELQSAESQARSLLEREPVSDGARAVLAEVCARRNDLDGAIRITEERRTLAASAAALDLLSEVEEQLRRYMQRRAGGEGSGDTSGSDPFDELEEAAPGAPADSATSESEATLPDIELVLEDESDDQDSTGSSVEPPVELRVPEADLSAEATADSLAEATADSLAEFEVEIADEGDVSERTAATQGDEDLEEAAFLIEQGMLDEAEARLRSILERVPNHPQALVRLGEVAAARRSRVDRASPERDGAEPERAIAQEQPADSPADDESPFDLAAELEDVLGDKQSAARGAASADAGLGGFSQIFAGFKSAIEAQVGEGEYETRYDLGIGYREMGLLEEAIREFELASRGGKRRLEALSSLAACKLEAGRATDAVQDLERALKLAGRSSESAVALRYELGEALAQAGEVARALQEYQYVQKTSPGFREVESKIGDLEGRVA